MAVATAGALVGWGETSLAADGGALGAAAIGAQPGSTMNRITTRERETMRSAFPLEING
jgi:hypothetical protein